MKLNRRQLITTTSAAGLLAAAGGVAYWWWDKRGDPKGASDRIDLPAGAYADLPYQSDPQLFAMLSLTGGMPSRTTMELRLFDLDGKPSSEDPPLSVSIANLVTGEFSDDVQLNPQDDGSWRLEQGAVESDGWWQVVAQIGDFSASWTFMMPDPNLTGFDTPPVMETDPDAQAMLSAALNTLTNRTSLRFWEWLSGGNGAIVHARFSVTTPESNGLPAAFENHSILAGRIPPDGSPPTFREENTRAISTDEEAFRSVNGGTPEPTNTINYLPIEEYDTTYAGHDGVHFGMTAEIEGRSCQLVAFHLPSTTEAWFAFWIDTETLFLRELFMLSVNHYMHWIYHDIDEPFELGFPE